MSKKIGLEDKRTTTSLPLLEKETLHAQTQTCGLFLDIDYFKTDGLSNKTIPNLLSKAVNLMWSKAESIATGLGL